MLRLRTGHYPGPIRVEGKHGSPDRPIVIRAARGAEVTFDGCLAGFQTAPNEDWEPARRFDPAAHEDEYVSRAVFDSAGENRVFRGAFLLREPFTRLITYSQLDDLRAPNQTWENVLPPNDERPGRDVVNEDGRPTGFRRPFVYMGPGILLGDIPPTAGRIHIRLSHTVNRVPGLADYLDETDPRTIPLAISTGEAAALVVRDSSFIRFENLTLRFGGAATVRIRSASDVVLDHVRILAATQGVSLVRTRGTRLRHCEILGGLPGWYFRTDRKGEYEFLDAGGTRRKNLLGKQTSSALIGCEDGNADLEIEHCELRDGHDLELGGRGVRFHHNWVHNLNDEALIVDSEPTAELHIVQNVITQCLSGLSFAGRRFPGGNRFVSRNLFDLRRPTASHRPGFAGDPRVLRFGHLYKGGGTDGPLDLVQNTMLVRSVRDRHASYTHYENDGETSGMHPRRSFNNIFIAVNPDATFARAITLLPQPDFPGPTDGNCYFRIGNTNGPLLQLSKRETFNDLRELWRSDYFEASKAQYPPGFEAASVELDPRFRHIAADGEPRRDDDLRLRPRSPLRKRGSDIGCYPSGSAPLRVGVDGRRSFPRTTRSTR